MKKELESRIIIYANYEKALTDLLGQKITSENEETKIIEILNYLKDEFKSINQ
ncbi:hypothetical protein [Clostridioides sp. ES-S-0048-02]|uniref:hypothetical protein n=1 Tax=Clostridioides sp. ES-S-0048-02 TaxID=2770777 RepID=UPI001D108FD6|nr:hypothetical protein [Clostridioides sp. ES-S-0048-02]